MPRALQCTCTSTAAACACAVLRRCTATERFKIGRRASRTACDAERRTIVDNQKAFLPRYH
ncbi:DUF1534 domain-containing protein [Pseudomonas syringae pv. theae]|nr:DUF1534 domain-containing protein [Pseudomonas syringae pv. theae]